MDPDRIPEVTRRRYLEACLSGDYQAALDVCQGLLDTGVAVPVLVRTLLAPALWRVGDLWMHGKVTVAQEHRVTAVTEAVIQVLMAGSTAERSTARVLLTGPEGEWHILPGRMVALVLRQLGWDVFQLTPALPPDDLLTLARAEQAYVAGISCSLPGNLVAAWQSVTALREAGFAVVAGGRAFDEFPGVAEAIGADGHARDPLQAHELLLGWVEQPPPGERPGTLLPRWEGLRSTWEATGRIVRDAAVLAVDIEGVALAGEVLRQDLTLMVMTSVSAALVDKPSILIQHIAWYQDLLAVGGIDGDVASGLLRCVGRVLPADADDIRLAIREAMASAPEGPMAADGPRTRQ